MNTQVLWTSAQAAEATGGWSTDDWRATGVSIDFAELALMPPGYRTYTFHGDGTIDSEIVWLDDERWDDRWQLPEWVADYFAGRLTDEEMRERTKGL